MDKLNNLMPIQEVNSRRSREQHSKDSSKGGKASAKKRLQKKTFKDLCDTFLDSEVTSEEMKEKMKALGINEDVSYKMAMVIAITHRAIKGDTKAFEVLRDTIGEKPKEEIEVSGEVNNPYKNLTEEELKKLAGE